MNKDEIREAYMQVSKELCNGTEWCWQGVEGPLERFATLIEQSVIKRLSAGAGEPVAWMRYDSKHVVLDQDRHNYRSTDSERFNLPLYTDSQLAAAVAAERNACAEHYLKIMRDAVVAEREACADIVEDAYTPDCGGWTTNGIAAAIRGRTA